MSLRPPIEIRLVPRTLPPSSTTSTLSQRFVGRIVDNHTILNVSTTDQNIAAAYPMGDVASRKNSRKDG